MEETKMKKVYNAPEFETTKFEVRQQLLEGPNDPGNRITNPWISSDPDETLEDFEW